MTISPELATDLRDAADAVSSAYSSLRSAMGTYADAEAAVRAETHAELGGRAGRVDGCLTYLKTAFNTGAAHDFSATVEGAWGDLLPPVEGE